MRTVKIIGLIVAILGLLTAIVALITEGIKLYRELPIATPYNITNVSPEIIFGPTNGKLDYFPASEQGISTLGSNLWLKNFIVQVKFNNPYDTSNGYWDYGIGFRVTNTGQEYRLYVTSDNTWQLYLSGEGKTTHDSYITQGQLNNLDTTTNGVNEIRLVAQNENADFFLNGILIEHLDLSEKNVAGDIYIGTGFLSGPEVSGEFTEYTEFMIWKLP